MHPKIFFKKKRAHILHTQNKDKSHFMFGIHYQKETLQAINKYDFLYNAEVSQETVICLQL